MPIRRIRQLPRFEPTLQRRYGLMAEPLLFETNDEALVAAADASFGRFPVAADTAPPLVVRLFTDPDSDRRAAGGSAAEAALVHRTHGRRLLISRGGADSAVVDVLAGEAVGFVSRATALDTADVRYSFVEAMALSMLHGRGYLALHASGVVRDGMGLCIQGSAGAGKSTLAVACARRGYAVLADDAVFATLGNARLELWGMPWTQRLLPDAARMFPELAECRPRRQPNGEWKLEVDLDELYPGSSVTSAAAGAIVLLARGGDGPTRVEHVVDGGAGLEVVVPWDVGWTPGHDRGLELLAERPLYRLHVNGTPDEAVDALDELLADMAAPAAVR